MRKMRWAVIALSGILLVGCMADKPGTPGGTGNDPDIRSGEENVPEKYTSEEAVADGHVVVVHGKMMSDPARLEAFIEETGKGMKKEVTVVQYTVEGDPILTTVRYDGEIYHGVEDNTRDRFGEQGYREFEYRYLKVLEGKGTTMVILVDDETLTFERYWESIASSQSDDWIPHHLLCSYQE